MRTEGFDVCLHTSAAPSIKLLLREHAQHLNNQNHCHILFFSVAHELGICLE